MKIPIVQENISWMTERRSDILRFLLSVWIDFLNWTRAMSWDVDLDINWLTDLPFILLINDWTLFYVNKYTFHVCYFKLDYIFCLAHQHFEVRSLRIGSSVLILKQRIFIHSESKMSLGWNTLPWCILFVKWYLISFRFLILFFQNSLTNNVIISITYSVIRGIACVGGFGR